MRLRHLIAAVVVALAALSARAQVDEAAYYQAIQSSMAPVSAERFAQLESAALAAYSTPDVYPPLVKLFASTTERLWAVIYGEVFINISPDERLKKESGALVFSVYDDAIAQPEAGKFSISLTRQSEINAADPTPPFGMNFEVSVLMGLLAGPPDAPTFRPGLEPLTLQALSDTRFQQLAIWQEKRLPVTALVRWQQEVANAGHFEAYNYWLFQTARPAEFEAWLRSHASAYEAFKVWQGNHRLAIAAPDFQRPMLRPGRR
jgi:hypothetical protein